MAFSFGAAPAASNTGFTLGAPPAKAPAASTPAFGGFGTPAVAATTAAAPAFGGFGAAPASSSVCPLVLHCTYKSVAGRSAQLVLEGLRTRVSDHCQGSSSQYGELLGQTKQGWASQFRVYTITPKSLCLWLICWV